MFNIFMGCSNTSDKQKPKNECKEEAKSEKNNNEQNINIYCSSNKSNNDNDCGSNNSNNDNNNDCDSNNNDSHSINSKNSNHININNSKSNNNSNQNESSPDEQKSSINEDSLTKNSHESKTNSPLEIEPNENTFDISFNFDKGNYGIILSPNITQIYQPNLTENSLIKMITNSLTIAKDKKQTQIKQLTPEQIKITSSIIYNSITLPNNDISELKPIHHPLLENVLIKVCLRDLTLDILTETCFKDKQIKPSDVKQALNDIQTQTIRNKTIKVLSIEIL